MCREGRLWVLQVCVCLSGVCVCYICCVCVLRVACACVMYLCMFFLLCMFHEGRCVCVSCVFLARGCVMCLCVCCMCRQCVVRVACGCVKYLYYAVCVMRVACGGFVCFSGSWVCHVFVHMYHEGRLWVFRVFFWIMGMSCVCAKVVSVVYVS